MSAAIRHIADQFQIIPVQDSYAELIAAINHLMLHDMDRLISILYRMDVSELKLKAVLDQHGETDAAVLVLQLMVERQEEKIKSRQQYSNRDNHISDEEKW